MLLQAGFTIGEGVQFLVDFGVYQYLLPFLLVFSIMFAILNKTKVLGGKTNIDGVVAMVGGLLLVVQQDIVETINTFLPKVSLIIVVILMFLILVALVAGKEFKGFQGAWMGLFIIVIIVALFMALNPNITFLNSIDRERLLQIGIFLGIMIGSFFLVTSAFKEEKGNKGDGGLGGFLKSLDKSLKD